MLPSRKVRYPGVPALLLIWTAVGLLAYTRHYLQEPGARIWPEVLMWLTCFLPWIVLSRPAFRLENRFRVSGPARFRNLAILGAASVAFALVASVLAIALGLAIGETKPPLTIPPGEIALQEFLFWATIGAGYAIRTLSRLQEKERESARLAVEKAELESSLKQAELEALRMRLNPHFLFNALQNISVLAEQDPRTAGRMLARLGDFLRVALRRDLQSEVTLEAEIGLTQAYLEVEKMRFGERLAVTIDVAPETGQALVPALLLQPLAENAIKHGLQGTAGGTLAIRSERQEGRLVLTVRDDGAGLPGENLEDLEVGVGLGSACERLARMYPRQHELSVRRLSEGGTEVRVALPFRAAGAADEARREQAASVDR
jgi:two-component system LytT family sensor kinase